MAGDLLQPAGEREIWLLTIYMKAGRSGRAYKIEIPAAVAVRLKSGLSQARFAALLGVSVRTLQDWEQGRREPSGAAKTLIRIAAKRPDVLHLSGA